MRSLLAFVLLALPHFVGAQDWRAVDAAATTQMKEKGVPGLSLAVVRDGKIVYEKGYGWADVENKVPATPETVYEIGSLTKQFTAAIVMQLVEEGKVKLDEPARTYLPQMPDAWKAVTVRNLLTHTSGIKAYTSIPAFAKVAREPYRDGEFFELVGSEKPDFSPGEKWQYDNSGYFLLGLMIEKITGHSFREELRRRILDPLGMAATDLNEPAKIVPHRASGYDPEPTTGPRNASYIDMDWPFAAGAMISTVGDLAKWDAALYTDKILKQSDWKQAWTPVTLNDGSTYPYGFGWALGEMNGVPTVEHEGGINGFNAFILRVPSKKLTVIALCNSMPGVTQPVASDVATLVDPSLKVQIKPIEDPDPALTAKQKTLLLSLLDGSLKKEDFTEQMQRRIFPDFVKVARNELNMLGPVKTFTLTGIKKNEGSLTRIYYATLGRQVVRMIVSTDDDGKVAGFAIQPG